MSKASKHFSGPMAPIHKGVIIIQLDPSQWQLIEAIDYLHFITSSVSIIKCLKKEKKEDCTVHSSLELAKAPWVITSYMWDKILNIITVFATYYF